MDSMTGPARGVVAGVDSHSGIVEAIRQLRVARDGAVKARTGAPNALGGLIAAAPEELRRQLLVRKTTRGRATLCARLRPDQARLQEPLTPPRPLCGRWHAA